MAELERYMFTFVSMRTQVWMLRSSETLCYNPSAGKAEAKDPWGLLDSQAGCMGDLLVQ